MKKATWIGVAIGIVLLLVVGGLFVANRTDRPILAVTTYRECDFVEWAGSVRVVCSDGTRWTVVQDAVKPSAVPPVVLPNVDKSLPIGDSIKVRYSHYWPAAGGVNCSRFVGGKCISKMASGKAWTAYIDEAVACPVEWAFGTVLLLDGKLYTCLDRGGMIKYVDGIPWIDVLTEKGAYPYGEIVTVQVIPSP